MRRLWTVLFVLAGLNALGLRAADELKEPTEEQKAAAARERIKAAKLIEELASEDFGAREGAEKGLIALGAGILPQVKDALTATKDTEVKTRLDRVTKALALDGEKDPDALAKLGKEDALAKRYAEAAKFYAKAADQYKKLAADEKDEVKQKDLAAKADKSAKRKTRAEGLAKNGTEEGGEEGGNGVRVIRRNQGGAQVQIVIQGGGGAGQAQVQIGGVAVAGEGAEEGEEGGNEDW
ncbi:MAG: hypothetical protein HY291_12880 [Planctomycetes bacterium]|nr:hypothetical protein [Planctomycetota bacterium]